MSGVVKLSVDKASDLIFDALIGAGVAARNARYFTDAILETELSGLEGHGLDWVPTYCAHVESGKVDGAANPVVKRMSLVSFRVDGQERLRPSGHRKRLCASRAGGAGIWRGGHGRAQFL